MRPYDRLIGAALDGERWLFARQETVEAAWQVVDPVLGDAVPVHPYPRGSWGPEGGRSRCCPTATPGTTRPAEGCWRCRLDALADDPGPSRRPPGSASSVIWPWLQDRA